MEDLRIKIKEIVADAIDLEVDEFEDEDDIFQQFGIDSVVTFEIVTKIQKKYSISIEDDEIQNIRSVDKIYDVIEKKMSLKTV